MGPHDHCSREEKEDGQAHQDVTPVILLTTRTSPSPGAEMGDGRDKCISLFSEQSLFLPQRHSRRSVKGTEDTGLDIDHFELHCVIRSMLLTMLHLYITSILESTYNYLHFINLPTRFHLRSGTDRV